MESEENDEDYDDDDEDDDEDYYYNDNDDENDSQVPVIAMSANLMKALGLDTSEIDTDTDWKPPARSGLDNSAPIINLIPVRIEIPTKSNFNSSIVKDNAVTNSASLIESNSNNYNNSDDEDEDDENDDYFAFDDAVGDDEVRGSVGMSANLMRILGLDPTEISSDWKPPNQSGLSNSLPIIPKPAKAQPPLVPFGNVDNSRTLQRPSSQSTINATNQNGYIMMTLPSSDYTKVSI
jgi:hypothetical protein